MHLCVFVVAFNYHITNVCEVQTGVPYINRHAFLASTALYKIKPFVGSEAVCMLSCNRPM